MVNPSITSKQLKMQNPDVLGQVSERTIQHRLRNELDLSCHTIAKKKPLLTAILKKKWVEICKKYKDWQLT